MSLMRGRKRGQEETSDEIEQTKTRKRTGKEETMKMKIGEDINKQHYRQHKQYLMCHK